MAQTQRPEAVEAPSEAVLTELAAEYYEAVGGEVHKDRDCHWQIVERWSYGEHVGWFVEHHGYLYELTEGEYGEEGPFPSREAALVRLGEQLRATIDDVRSWHGG